MVAAYVRSAAEDHDDWDVPHHFSTVHWDPGTGELSLSWMMAITLDVGPEQMSLAMIRFAAEQSQEQPGRPPVAYLLEAESYGVHLAPGASAAERRQLEEHARSLTLDQHPDAVEDITVICADIHGRVWQARKRRDTGEIDEKFWRPGNQPPGPSARLVLRIAEAGGRLVRLAN